MTTQAEAGATRRLRATRSLLATRSFLAAISSRDAMRFPPPSSPSAAILASAVTSLAVWIAAAAHATSHLAPLKVAEGRYLALVVALVVAASTTLSPRTGTWLGVGALAILWTVPYGPTRASLLSMTLGLGLAIAARDAFGSVSARIVHTVALALGLQALVRPDLLLHPLVDARTLVSLLVLPTIAGVGCATLAAVLETRSEGSAGVWPILVATSLLAPGWNVTVTASIAVVALTAVSLTGFTVSATRSTEPPALWRRVAIPAGLVVAALGLALRDDPEGAAAGVALLVAALPASGRLRSIVGALVLLLAVPVVVLAAYPWARPDPLLDLRAAASSLRIEPLARRPLDAQLEATVAPSQPLRGTLEGLDDPRDVRTVLLDTSIVHGPALEVGQPIAELLLLRGDDVLRRHVVRAGIDTADWAAARPDVVGLPGFEAPPGWRRHVAPDGRFFGQQYRAAFDGDPVRPDRLLIRLDRSLPPDARLLVHGIGLR